MRILLVNDFPYGGGAERVVTDTIHLLRERGLDARPFTIADVGGHRTPWTYVFSTAAEHRLRERISAFRPDVIHLHNFYHCLSPSILAAIDDSRRDRDVRCVATAHDYHLICPNPAMQTFRGPGAHACEAPLRLRDYLRPQWDRRGRAHSLLRALQHLLCYRVLRLQRAIDLLISPSAFAAEKLAGLGLPTVVIENPSLFAAAPSHFPPGLGLRIALVGRVEPEKGFGWFLDNVDLAAADRVRVVGDGSELRRCQDVVARRGIVGQVEFGGAVAHDDIPEVLAWAHTLVIPSTCIEAAPLTAIEALAGGASLVVPTGGSAERVVEATGRGKVYHQGDGADLRRVIHEVRTEVLDGTYRRVVPTEYLGRHDPDRYVARLLQAYAGEMEPKFVADETSRTRLVRSRR